MRRITSATQPFCRWCGKALKKATRTVWIESVDSRNKDSCRDSIYSRYVFVTPKPTSKAECQRLSNLHVISVQYVPEYKMGDHVGRVVRSFGEWDGQSYETILDYFCSNVCAAALGRAAYRDRNICGPEYLKAIAESKGD